MADVDAPQHAEAVERAETAHERPVRGAEFTPDEMVLPSDAKSIFLGGTFFLVLLCVLHESGEIVLPILLALVLKLLLQPGMRFLQRFYVPKGIAALLLIAAMFGLFVGFGTILSGPAANWGSKLPDAVPKLQERLSFISVPIGKALDVLHQAERYAGSGLPAAAKPPAPGTDKSKTEAPPTPAPAANLTQSVFTATGLFASGLFTTVLVLFFLLVAGETFLKKLVEILPRFGDKRQAVEISQQVEKNISAYLITITIMNTLVGIATTLLMWACGVADPILWGAVAFFANYVPILGPFACVGLFALVGLISIDALWLALLLPALYLMIHVAEGEVITPMLLARRFTLNPVLVIVSLVFWHWMWGVPGAILAVPLLAITKIICDGIRPLAAVGHFLEG